jgi:type IX secretion system protein PorV
MNPMKTLQYIVMILLVMPAPAARAQKVGSTSMQFLKVMPCARGAALGDAYSVWASGADALFWNPAGLALVKNSEVSSTYISWIFDSRQAALGYAYSLGDAGAVGAQLQYVDYGEFEETTNERPYISDVNAPGMTGRTFRPLAYAVGVTYARSLSGKFSTGLTVKYVHEALFDGQMVLAMISQGVYEDVSTSASGVLFDFGMRYNTGYRTIQVGASVQNFGADVKYAIETNPVPLLFRFGIAADLLGPDALLAPREGDNRLGVAFDLFQPNDYTQQAHVGLEYEFAGVVALRGGYKFNYDSEGFTIGGGLKHMVSSVNLIVDYSYGSIGTYLGNVQRISVGASF